MPLFTIVSGQRVGEADVILMGFPLMRSLSDMVRTNDMYVYQQVSTFCENKCRTSTSDQTK